MSNLEAALVNACDIPELSEFEEPGMKQPDWRGIIVHTVDFIFGEGNGYVCLGRYARINMAITDVSHLETTLAAVLQEANSIVGRQVA
jgi:phosphoribosyl 1,2-cyclic phosphodiesterase